MKTCQACGHGNADDMRFCLECGKPLPDAPIVFNISGGSQPDMGGPPTNPFGGPTNFGAPGFQQQSQPTFSMVPPAKPKSSKKIYIAVGGIFALILLVFLAVAGIVAYNLMKSEDTVVKSSPTPTSSSTVSTPKKSGSETPKPDASKSTKSDGEPRATIGKIRADFNVKEGGRTGMRIFTTFTVYDLKGSDLYLALYFQKEDGTPLKTSNTKFASSAGDVAVFKELKPGFDETFYDELELFIPYDEFKLSKGKYNLKIDASVIYKVGGLVDHLDYYPFEYEKF
ncbi:MAG: zinc ribbon domain-containing protein [Acidobacteria bacterium]|nr:zinc ribbon domain-containing protein [Acidobacteriota bacterium]MBK8810262.1 zinc ribbon domain-containing protein [Acidobacteriota bacterium]